MSSIYITHGALCFFVFSLNLCLNFFCVCQRLADKGRALVVALILRFIIKKS